MPIYEYQCHACGHVFDQLQKLSDPDPSECERCHQGPVARRLTAPAFRLAGSGWYETDFKKDSDKKRNLAGDSAATSSTSSPGTSSGESSSTTTSSSTASTPAS